MKNEFVQSALNVANCAPADGGGGTRRTPADGGGGTRTH